MRWVPFSFCLLLAFGLWKTLSLYEDMASPSKYIEEPLPAFELSILNSEETFSSELLKGRVSVLNIFASWCTPCLTELPQFHFLAKGSGLTVIGIAWNDTPENTTNWLNKNGNPFTHVLMDSEGQVINALDTIGLPETYIIDKKGILRYRHRGPITKRQLEQIILPTITHLENEE